MDQASLRVQLEQALSAEPPLGNLVGNSVRAGRKLRRRRAGAAVLSAAVVVVVGAAATLMSSAGHKSRQPQPVAAAGARTAYVAAGTDAVVPINLATNAVGTPIRVPVTADTGLNTTNAAATPDGQAVYEVGMTVVRSNPQVLVTPIDAATHVAGPSITLPNDYAVSVAIDPNGKTAYVGGQDGVYPINVATNTAGKRIRIPGLCWAMAFTPDGKALYVLDDDGGYGTLTVTPILTATNTALAPITLLPKGTRNPAPYGWDIAITPNGKTAYVVAGVQEGKPYDSSVIPVDLVTNKALAPIKLEASGLASGLVIAPGGRTAYVLSSRAVTPIDTTTNQAEPAINLPGSAGYAFSIALTPNGKTLYVFTPRGVVPIRTASNTVLPMITIPGIAPFTDAAAITPDGRTVYVATSTDVVPVSTATNTAGRPIDVSAAVGPQSCPVKRSCLPAPVGIAFAR